MVAYGYIPLLKSVIGGLCESMTAAYGYIPFIYTLIGSTLDTAYIVIPVLETCYLGCGNIVCVCACNQLTANSRVPQSYSQEFNVVWHNY